MHKKRFNWKARQSDSTVKVDDSETKKIKLSLNHVKSENYDDSNALVLPSKKRKTEISLAKEPKKKPLTKKQLKEREKLKEKRTKTARRMELFKELAEVQVDNDVLSKLVSTSDMQTKKWSTKIEENFKLKSEDQDDPEVAKLLRQYRASSSKCYKRNLMKEKREVQAEDEIDTSDISTDPEWSNEIENKPEADEPQGMEIDSTIPVAPVTTTQSVEGEAKAAVTSSDEPKKIFRKTVHVPVNRSKKVELERQKLPVCKEEQAIMETINENDVVIIQGETGTGKTTQIPQFLYEAGYALDGHMIGVTEPRRIAAISMSQRVRHEMNLSPREVSYQIRYEGNTSDDTKIKFMTDGILLKEAQSDKLLERYGAVILDEAHERSLYTDVLIGLLSVIVRQRRKMEKPLKLIIMSATLKDTDFTENKRLFPEPPPVVKVDSRQHNVFVHFNKKTPANYVQEAYKKVCKINTKLPKGGILVFATSQQEVNYLCSKLRKTFPDKAQAIEESDEDDDDDDDDDDNAEKAEGSKANEENDKPTLEEEEAMLENDDETVEHIEDDYHPSDDDSFDDSDDDDEMMTKLNAKASPLHVLPLYAMLSSRRQAMVFKPPPEGSRLCIIATNVAETSITIPGIRYVVDTGKVKSKFYDPVSGVSTFRVTNISQASANQRCGRAGRTGPGHCYRLYSSAVYEDLEKYSAPEITKIPIDGLVLQLQYMNIKDIRNYPLPTPPSLQSTRAAENLLRRFGALTWDSRQKAFSLTSTGRLMARIPVAPRYGKLLCSSHQHQLMPYAISIVAGLSIPEVFIGPGVEECQDDEDKSESRLDRQKINHKLVGEGQPRLLGDAMKLLKVIHLFDAAKNQEEFCREYGVRFKAMIEIRKLRKQLVNTLNTIGKGLDIKWDPNIPMPTESQIRYLRNLMLIGSVDHVARRMPVQSGLTAEEKKKRKDAYQDMYLEEPVFIHPSSVVLKSKPEFVVYQQIEETSRLYMKGITVIEPEWLPNLAPFDTLFDDFKNDDPDIVPRYNETLGYVVCKRASKFGPQCWKIPAVEAKLDDRNALKWFAKFFLDGLICPKLKKLIPLYNCITDILLKDTAYCIQKSSKLLNALDNKGILTKDKLYSEWVNNPTFLCNEYSLWLPPNQHSTVRAMWPPL